MSGLTWIKTVCKDYQQTALVGKELTIGPDYRYRDIKGDGNIEMKAIESAMQALIKS